MKKNHMEILKLNTITGKNNLLKGLKIAEKTISEHEDRSIEMIYLEGIKRNKSKSRVSENMGHQIH